jgi:hypothetical protein
VYQTGTCVPLAGEGESCTYSADCQTELYCSAATSKCTAYPPDGGDCTSQGSSFQCRVGQFCDFSAPNQDYVCTPKKALGEVCSYDGICQSNRCEYGQMPDGGYAARCVAPCSERGDGG